MTSKTKAKRPDFQFEIEHWQKGCDLVIGVDEVGRGCFAGPIVAAAVAFTPDMNPESEILTLGINDSKKLTPKARERLDKEIRRHALAWTIAEIPVSNINNLGMGKACAQVMRKAVCEIAKKAGKRIDYALVDGYHVMYVPGIGLKRQRGIVNGDQKSLSIAAASIIAKVYRDSMMQKLSERYPHYAWDENKGYGTEKHQKAIFRYGLTRYHRKDFVRTWQENLSKKA